MREVKFDEWKQIRTENAGAAIVLSDGSRFIVPPMDLWPDVSEMKNDEIIATLAGEHAEQAKADGVNTATILRILNGTDDAEETGKSGASADS